MGVILQCNSSSVDADFEQVTVSIRLFFTWVLCIYIILDKGCHIFYVFGLNSTVCSHIVGLHLPRGHSKSAFVVQVERVLKKRTKTNRGRGVKAICTFAL